MIHLATYAVALVVALYCTATVYWSRTRTFGIIAAGFFGMTGLLIIGMFALPTVIFDAQTYLGDFWTILDAANKASYGIASSRDYFSPIGPVYDWLFRFTLFLKPLSATIVASASAVFAALVVALAFAMLVGRISLITLSLTCLIAVTAILSPRDVDQSFAATGMNWLAPYNRWAWGLLVPVVLALCGPHQLMGRLGSSALGLALTLLLLLKITYGIAAIGLLLVCVVLRHRTLLEGFFTLTVMLVSLILAELLSGQVLAHLADLRTASTLSSNGLRIIKLVAQLGEMLVWMSLALALWLAFVKRLQLEADRWQTLLLPMLIITVAAMSCVILMQKHFVSGSPIYLLLPLITAEWVGLLKPRAAPLYGMAPPCDGLLALLLVIILPIPIMEAGHVAAQYVQHARFPNDPTRSVTAQGDFIIHERWLRERPCSEDICRDHLRLVAGLDALRALGADQVGAGRVLALNFSNPFPFFLTAPSPAAAPIWLHIDRSFSAASFTPAERMFAGVGYVMYAQGEPNGDALFAIYADFIKQQFTEARRLDAWVIYVRR